MRRYRTNSPGKYDLKVHLICVPKCRKRVLTGAVAERVRDLKGGSSRIMLQEFPRLRKQFWGRHLWARGYMAISSGNITDDMVQKYIDEQEGEPIDDNQFQIDPTL